MGVLSIALKKNRGVGADFDSAIATNTQLNRASSEAFQKVQEKAGTTEPIHAVTDITGFGLLGHAREMALGSPERGIEVVSLEIDHAAISFLPGALEAARGGFLSGGLKNNRDFIGDCVGFAENVPQEYRDLLFDPQTSGGLLIAITPKSEEAAVAALDRHGVTAQRIGKVIPKTNPLLSVR